MANETETPDERVLEDQKLVSERKDHLGNPIHPPKDEEASSRKRGSESEDGSENIAAGP